jgi:hypothetical protein
LFVSWRSVCGVRGRRWSVWLLGAKRFSACRRYMHDSHLTWLAKGFFETESPIQSKSYSKSAQGHHLIRFWLHILIRFWSDGGRAGSVSKQDVHWCLEVGSPTSGQNFPNLFQIFRLKKRQERWIVKGTSSKKLQYFLPKQFFASFVKFGNAKFDLARWHLSLGFSYIYFWLV